MERVTTKEAAKLLNMDVVTLQFFDETGETADWLCHQEGWKEPLSLHHIQKYVGCVYPERREMLNGRKTILLVEIAGRFLSGTNHQTTANFAGGR